MPRSSNQKMKSLYLARILLERTDDNNPLTAQGLVDALTAYDIPANRKSIYDDIEALRRFGLDIELRRGKNGGYFIASRDFDLPELKLLVDAVQSSRLITDNKSRELIKKLSKLASMDHAKQLNRQVFIHGRAKPINETVYYSIDAIHEAINNRRKIQFMYFDYNTKKKRVYRMNAQAYVRTPVAMCWNEDKYYLVTFHPMFDNPFASFRVDRMSGVEILEEESEKIDHKTWSLTDYIKQTFGMYSGEIVHAKLGFDQSLVNVVLDHFGSDIRLIDVGDGRFVINTEVSNSPVFLGWIFQFGDKAEIIQPESLRIAMSDLITKSISIYGKDS